MTSENKVRRFPCNLQPSAELLLNVPNATNETDENSATSAPSCWVPQAHKTTRESHQDISWREAGRACHIHLLPGFYDDRNLDPCASRVISSA